MSFLSCVHLKSRQASPDFTGGICGLKMPEAAERRDPRTGAMTHVLSFISPPALVAPTRANPLNP